ncbi:hypothetical protein [Massilia sp.]|uniref:hypothetical protein n=1 Tax=Massilia sp. TaxID=1882437 RepID=UPI00352EE4ED
MRDYGKVYTAFWSNEDMRAMSEDARMLALYLMTCPHGNMLGCFRLPNAYAAEDLKWDIERVSKGFDELFENGFSYRCQRTFWVFIRKYLQWNQFENPNVGKAAGKLFDSLSAPHQIKALLINALREFSPSFPRAKMDAFDELSIPFENPFGTISKTVVVAVAVTKPEPEQEQTHVERRGASPDRDVVQEIFAYWQKTMEAPRAQLDDKRVKVIKAALKHYEPRQVCEAILGCSRSAWHMGQNDRGQKYNGLNLILRSADYIDKFIEMASKQTNGPETIEERNARILAEWIAGDATVTPDVIDVEMEEVTDEA